MRDGARPVGCGRLKVSKMWGERWLRLRAIREKFVKTVNALLGKIEAFDSVSVSFAFVRFTVIVVVQMKRSDLYDHCIRILIYIYIYHDAYETLVTHNSA
jgi:hypothetical protein